MPSIRRGLALGLALLLASSAEAAIAYRSESHVASITGMTSTPTEPSGAASGDVFVACVQESNLGTLSMPAGWTALYTGSTITGTQQYWVGYIVRGGSAPDLTWTFVNGAYRNIEISAFSGSTGVEASAAATSDQSATGPLPPAATATSANDWAIVCGVKDEFAPAWVAPTGYTIRGASDQDAVQADKSLGASGTETPQAFTGTGINDITDRWASTVLLAPAASVSLASRSLLGVGKE